MACAAMRKKVNNPTRQTKVPMVDNRNHGRSLTQAPQDLTNTSIDQKSAHHHIEIKIAGFKNKIYVDNTAISINFQI